MSVELGSDPEIRARAGVDSYTQGQDTHSPSWKAELMSRLAEIWKVEVSDLEECFPEAVVLKKFLERLLQHAHCYPKNVFIPLLREVRVERFERKRAGGPNLRPSYRGFMPCDVTDAMEKAANTLRASQITSHSEEPRSRWTSSHSSPHGRVVLPKDELVGTPPHVVSDLSWAPESCRSQGVTSDSELSWAQTRTHYSRGDGTGVDNPENTYDALHKAPNVCRQLGGYDRYGGISGSGSGADDDDAMSEGEHTIEMTFVCGPLQSDIVGEHTDQSDDSDVICQKPLRRRRRLTGGHISQGSGPVDGKLIIPSDGPQLRDIINMIEEDSMMCYKMRWYVARHVRQEFQEDVSLSRQRYKRRIDEGHQFRMTPKGRDKLIALRKKPFNRLDFEVMRAQVSFYKDQPGWKRRGITQILQAAYTKFYLLEREHHQ